MSVVSKIVEVHCNLHRVDKIEENYKNDDNFDSSFDKNSD